MGATQEAMWWLEILTSKGISPRIWLGLKDELGLEELVSLVRRGDGRETLSKLIGRRVNPPNRHFLEKQLGMIDKEEFSIASIEDANYPPLLKEIAVPPPILYFQGDIGKLTEHTVCIVGSRAASRAGLIRARKLASGLSMAGVHVVSGLARGIDTAAHKGALEECGGTSAVLGTGIDVIYPRENKGLAQEIIEKGGTFITEFPPGTGPHKYNFPRRNRLLSGLSLGTVVVQADSRSGAMGTAMWALEQNREVFAVPGPIESPLSRGPHSLIKRGAHLVESALDILEVLRIKSSMACMQPGFDFAEQSKGVIENGSSVVRRVVSSLGTEPKHVDEIVEICNISPDELLPILLELEIRGVVVSCGGNSFALAVEG